MEVQEVVIHQLNNLFPVKNTIVLGGATKRAEEAAIKALSGFNNKYFRGKIDPLNGVMYTNYLYWLSRYCYEDGFEEVASMVYALNKMLHAVDLFYAITLPEIWTCEHPLGSVMGRAKYGDGFVFLQGCTVGGNKHNGTLQYPVLGQNVLMYSNSKILGDSHIGDNVTLAANTYVINESIPDNCLVFGQSPNLLIKKKR